MDASPIYRDSPPPVKLIHYAMKKRKNAFDKKKEVRAIARERVGAVKPSRAIPPDTSRKKPKHKKKPEDVGNEIE